MKLMISGKNIMTYEVFNKILKGEDVQNTCIIHFVFLIDDKEHNKHSLYDENKEFNE